MDPTWRSKTTCLADLIRRNKGRIVIYTGAGISTAANIPDYRGTNGQYIQKVPESSSDLFDPPASSSHIPSPKRARRSTNDETKSKASSVVPKKLRLPEATHAQPTYTHMAIKVLVELGYVRHVVSQNVDGLHIRSGMSRERLSELHGNLFLEQCSACYSVIQRRFDVAETTSRNHHFTGRICPQCRLNDPDNCNSFDRLLCKTTKDLFDSVNDLNTYILARNRAALRIYKHHSKPFDFSKSRPVPFLRDVIVHYHEKQPEPGLAEIYRVSAAVNAVHGISTFQPGSNNQNIKSQPSCSYSQLDSLGSVKNDSSSFDSPSTYNSSASLIIIIGSSLQVLRSYKFLWPPGLGRCLKEKDDVSSKSSGTRITKDARACHLAIINLQPTCKDGLANVVIRMPCDQVLKAVMCDELGLEVPDYKYRRDDPLYRSSIALFQDEEFTRSREDIPFDQL